ncbi:MAG: hypothetical protein KC492_27585, partial [Myxococcales bacterium]|nr:hypothetical protein [Myxococcales bacterium]
MGRRRQQLTALTEPERTRLRKLADACASDAELLSELFQLMPDSPHKFAELLHTEFGVPVVAARTWLIEDGLRSGLRMEELADRCWRWIHSTFRGAEPARRVATLTEQDSALVDSRAREIDRLVTTPVARDRATFERALAEAYRLADLPPPRVLWVDGPGAGILMVMLCLYHGTERQRLAGILSERRFAQPPEHDLGAAM